AGQRRPNNQSKRPPPPPLDLSSSLSCGTSTGSSAGSSICSSPVWASSICSRDGSVLPCWVVVGRDSGDGRPVVSRDGTGRSVRGTTGAVVAGEVSVGSGVGSGSAGTSSSGSGSVSSSAIASSGASEAAGEVTDDTSSAGQ